MGTGFSLLEAFAGSPTDGGSPQSGELTLSADGSQFYGMTFSGGTLGRGVVFSRAVPGAIPEPGAFALLGLGALLLSACRRRAQNYGAALRCSCKKGAPLLEWRAG